MKKVMKRVLGIIWMALCIITMMIVIIDLIQFTIDSSTYPIGTNSLFMYRTEFLYMLSSALYIIWFALGGFIGYKLAMHNSSLGWFISHLSITVLYLLYIHFEYLQ